MRIVDKEVLISAVNVSVRTGQELSLVVASNDNYEPTHFVVVISVERVGDLGIQGFIPVLVEESDFS